MLDCGVLRNLEALEESASLLTISWEKGMYDDPNSLGSSLQRRLEGEALVQMYNEGGSSQPA